MFCYIYLIRRATQDRSVAYGFFLAYLVKRYDCYSYTSFSAPILFEGERKERLSMAGIIIIRFYILVYLLS